MSTLHTDLESYYTQRADGYDAVYAAAAQQADLAILRERVPAALAGHNVLELACGSAYWTALLAESADFVLATDNNPAMLKAAQQRDLPMGKVQIAQIDALDLQLDGGYSACFAGFFWSHIKREDQARFLAGVRQAVGKDGLLVLVDDTYQEHDAAPVARTDAQGNTYQIETLGNGERYEYVKNFPTDSWLRKHLAPAAKEIRILRLEHYWMLTCRLK